MGERGRLMRRAGDNPVDSTYVDEMMGRAIEASRWTYPHPNPRVGAVLTSSDGAVLSVASHRTPGESHAEALVLGLAEHTSGTTLYVSLEPCDHHGRTPPCTDAIIDAGVSRVVVGKTDPDPRVSGQGIERLRGAGIEVTVGVLAEQVVENDPGYFHHRSVGTPRVTLKLASTLDGQAGASDGSSQWITSPEAREDAHRLRSENDVIIVGAGTVIQDNPELTVRLDGYDGPQPLPVIICGAREIPEDSRILTRDPIIYRPTGPGGVDPVDVVQDLGKRGIVAAMIEGGPSIAGSFLRSGVVDEIVWYIASKIAGGSGIPAIAGDFRTMSDITGVTITGFDRIGPDLKVTAVCSKEP